MNAEASIRAPAVSDAWTAVALVLTHAILVPVATGRIWISAPIIALVKTPRVSRCVMARAKGDHRDNSARGPAYMRVPAASAMKMGTFAKNRSGAVKGGE